MPIILQVGLTQNWNRNDKLKSLGNWTRWHAWSLTFTAVTLQNLSLEAWTFLGDQVLESDTLRAPRWAPFFCKKVIRCYLLYSRSCMASKGYNPLTMGASVGYHNTRCWYLYWLLVTWCWILDEPRACSFKPGKCSPVGGFLAQTTFMSPYK